MTNYGKNLLTFIIGFLIGFLTFNIVTSVFSYTILTTDETGKETAQIINPEKDFFATSTFNSIADYDKAYSDKQYQDNVIKYLDLILKELRKINE